MYIVILAGIVSLYHDFVQLNWRNVAKINMILSQVLKFHSDMIIHHINIKYRLIKEYSACYKYIICIY